MLGGFFEPFQDRVFFVAGRARQAADPVAFGAVGQDLKNRFIGCPASVKQCPFRFGKGLLTGLASVTLPTGLGVTKLDYVSLVVSL